MLLDMVMPKMSGKETFFAMKEINAEVKVLLSSGFCIDGEAREILEQGVQGFIQKPFRTSALNAALVEVLS